MQGFLHEYGGKGKCCNLGVMGSCPTELGGHVPQNSGPMQWHIREGGVELFHF